jgi:hypothetical protein
MCSILPRVCTANPGDTRERHEHRPAAKHELRRNARPDRTAILRGGGSRPPAAVGKLISSRRSPMATRPAGGPSRWT